jgi:hypothetical protein
MTTSRSKQQLEQIAQLRTDGLTQGWSIPQIVEAIVDRFGVSWLEAHRLARGWTRRRAVDEILRTYDVDGLARPSLTPQRLCAWEHDPKIRPARTIWTGCAGCMRPDPTCWATVTTTPQPRLSRPSRMGDPPSPPRVTSQRLRTLVLRQRRWPSCQASMTTLVTR